MFLIALAYGAGCGAEEPGYRIEYVLIASAGDLVGVELLLDGVVEPPLINGDTQRYFPVVEGASAQALDAAKHTLTFVDGEVVRAELLMVPTYCDGPSIVTEKAELYVGTGGARYEFALGCRDCVTDEGTLLRECI